MTAVQTPPVGMARRAPAPQERSAPTPALARTLDMLFARTARRIPDAIAVREPRGRLTYGHAESKSTRLASALLRAGVQLGEPVIVQCDDHRQALVAQLAVLKAGGVCVPVPLTTNRACLTRIAQVSGARSILCSTSTRPAWDLRGPALALDDPATWELVNTLPRDPALPCSSSTDGAYLLITDEGDGSASGYLTDHRAWRFMLTATINRLGVGDRAVMVRQRPIGARTLSAMWWAFACGGTLHAIGDAGFAATAAWGRTAVAVLSPEEHVRVLQAADSAADGAASEGPRTVLLLGGPCPSQLVERHFRLLPDTRLWAQFVPAGATLPWTVQELIPRGDSEDSSSSVGQPLPHVHVQILNPGGGPLPPGGIGEVCASGPALAFDRVPSASGHPPTPDAAPLLRSGQLGRWRTDGSLEILGPAPGRQRVRQPGPAPDEQIS